MLIARLALSLGALLMADIAPAAECRAPDSPQLLHERRTTRCVPAGRSTRAAMEDRLHRGKDLGFVDLGNGTQVKISGRVRAELVVQR